MPENDQVNAKVAELLLQIKAIKLQPQSPFIWTTGWKSPIYCDNRIILSYPNIRDYIIEELKTGIESKISMLSEIDVIAGVATSGIAFGALVASSMNLPFVYVRPEAKAHGLGKKIEGEINSGQRVVVVEDLISTGSSSLKVVETLRETGCEVLGLVAIFSYGFDVSKNNFETANCKYTTLSDYSALMNTIQKEELFSEEDLKILAAWSEDPENWMVKEID